MTSADDMASEEPCALGDLRIRINRLTDPNQVWQFDGELINYEVDPCRTIKLVMTPTYNIPNIDEATKRAMLTHPAKSLVLLPALRHLEREISSFRSAQTNCEFQVNFVTSELEEEIARLKRKVEELQHERREDDVPVVTASVVEPVAAAAPHAAVDTDLLLEVQRKYAEAQKLLAERTRLLDELTREKPKIEQDAEEKLRRELARNEQDAEEKLRRELARKDEDCSTRLAQRELEFADHLKAEVEKVTNQRKTQDRLVSKEFKRLNEDIKRHNEEIEKQNQIIANLRNQALKRTRDDAERSRLENDDAKRSRPDPQPHVLRKPPPPPPKMKPAQPVPMPKAIIPPPLCHTYGETSSSSSQLANLECPRPRTEASQMNNHGSNNKPKRMIPGVPLRVKKEQLSSPREGYLFPRVRTGYKRRNSGFSLKPRTPRKPRLE